MSDYTKMSNESLVEDFYWKIKLEPEAVRMARMNGWSVEEVKEETIKVKDEILRRLNKIEGG